MKIPMVSAAISAVMLMTGIVLGDNVDRLAPSEEHAPAGTDLAKGADAAVAKGAAIDNKVLASLVFPEMNGWYRRTRDSGFVNVIETKGAEPAYVEVGPKAAGDNSILHCDIKLTGVEAARIRLTATWRVDGVEGGKDAYQRAVIQARFTKAGKEFGDWVSLVKNDGTTAWAESSTDANLPADADGMFVRVAAYGCKSGRICVSKLSVEAVTAAAVAAHRLRFRPAQEYGEPVPEARFNKLYRGVSINNWFSQPYNEKINGEKGGFNAKWFDEFVPDSDLKNLAESGVRHIRIALDPEPFMDMETGAVKKDMLAMLDKTMKRITSAGMAVVLNPHPKMPRLKAMRTTPGLPEKFIRWSSEIAEYLNTETDPDWVIYEPLNEPAISGYYMGDWIPMQDQLVNAIRAKAPKHTLILNAAGYQLWSELLNFPAHPDRNTLFSVHYYQPSSFTHQGSQWMRSWYFPLRKVPWPFDESDLPQIIADLDRTGKNAEYASHSEQVMRRQARDGEGLPAKIEDHFDQVAAWGKANNRRIIIGEFGVDRLHVDEDSRARWLQFIRESCEKRNFGWAHWEYQHQLGFVSGEPGKRVYEEKASRALGFDKKK